MTLGERIRQAMEDQDISQKELAAKLNLAVSTLNGYLHDYREPDYETLVAIARYFSLSVDYLIGNTPEGRTRLTEEEKAMLQYFRSLTNDQRELLLEQAKLYLRHNRKKAEKSSHSA